MVTASNFTVPATSRRDRRRQATIDEALDHAVEIMADAGVGGLTITEMARRMGVTGPSLYKYFPSLHAVYDALFARGLDGCAAELEAVLDVVPPGVDRIRAGVRTIVRWCVEHPALAQLLYWRPVPGFEPSPETFAASVAAMAQLDEEVAAAVDSGELDASARSAAAVRLLTVVISGLITQQMANEPGASFDNGSFTELTDTALDMYFAHYQLQRGN